MLPSMRPRLEYFAFPGKNISHPNVLYIGMVWEFRVFY